MRHRRSSVCLIPLLFALLLHPALPRVAAEECASFPETGYQVCGVFLTYWRDNGGLPVYGYPITPAQPERNAENGQTYLTQWFERNRFEHHPENAGTKYEVLLGLLGRDLRREAVDVDPDFQRAARVYNAAFPAEQQAYFEETGHNLRFGFLTYWQQNGGLERLGFPISEEHPEYDENTGKAYVTQWFERARMEYHPENAEPYNILLGLLGNEIKKPRAGAAFAWKVGQGYNDLTRPQGVTVDQNGSVYVTDTERHRIQKYDSNGSFLTRWGGLGGEDGQFNRPRAVTVDGSGSVYVLDSGNYRVQKFDANGNFVAKWGGKGRGDGQFGQVSGLGATDVGPADIAADQNGIIYVADQWNNRVQKFTGDGRFLGQWGSDQLRLPSGIAANRSGLILVTDFSARVHVFDNSGQAKAAWGSQGVADGQFVDPLNLAITVGQDNAVYVTDWGANRVQKFDANGRFLVKWGSSGSADGQFFSPGRIAIGGTGNLYITDLGNNRVQKFDSSGRFLAQWGSSAGTTIRFLGIRALAVGGSDLYVVDSDDAGKQARIMRFDVAGRFVTQWAAPSSSNDRYKYPIGIAADSNGYVYVADAGNNRVLKYDRMGVLVAQWSGLEAGGGQLDRPFSIAIDQSGTIYVADSSCKIRKFDVNGRFLASWDPQIGVVPCPLAVDGRGNVFIVGNFYVRKLDSNGQRITQWGSRANSGDGGDEFGGYGTIAVDTAGRVIVPDVVPALESSDSKVRVKAFDGNGQFLYNWGSYGWADGQLGHNSSLPRVRTVAADSLGNVYIGDYFNNRIQKFRLR
jgi:tripartite motif-containing protein 71